MSHQAEPSAFAGRLDAAALEARGYKRCEHCAEPLPALSPLNRDWR